MLSLAPVSVNLHPPQQTCCDFFSSCAICLISHSNSSNCSALSSPPSLAQSSIMQIDISSGSRVAPSMRNLVQNNRALVLGQQPRAGAEILWHNSISSNPNAITPARLFVSYYKHRRDAGHISSELRKAECVAVFDPDNVSHMPDVHFASPLREVFFSFRKFSGLWTDGEVKVLKQGDKLYMSMLLGHEPTRHVYNFSVLPVGSWVFK